MLKLRYRNEPGLWEAGVDEAGRGCLAGPVVAAAVILPPKIPRTWKGHLNDSKKLSPLQRQVLRKEIEDVAVSYGIAMADHHEIDQINILNASLLAMHRAIEKLNPQPGLLL
ncbi:MAG: ribonuclease HII, partial [Bacteroidota bacterium]